VVHQIKTIKLVELNFIFKENALFERKSKAKTNCSWPLTLIMQKPDHFRLLRHHYSESPVIPRSNDIWYRCVAHGFITFYFLIFYRWSNCHHFSSVVCLSTFHILIFSSETTEPIATKLWWNGPWMAPFQNFIQWSWLPTKMAAKLKIEKRGDEILIVHCCFSISQNELKF
jgi:hypothetical protein